MTNTRITLPLVVVTLLVVQSSAGSAVVADPVQSRSSGETTTPVVVQSLDDGNVPVEVLLLTGFSRDDESDPLENDNRSAVYESVVDSPGIHLAGVVEAVDVHESTVRYHVRVLEREGLIRTETVRGKRRLCPSSTSTIRGAAAMSDAATAPLIRTVRRHEPVTVSRIATEIDRKRSTASYHLTRLEDDGLLTRDRDGESVLVSLTPEARTMFDAEASHG